LRFDLVLNNLVAWACSTSRIFIKSDGTPWRPIVHIADISRAFLAILEAPVEAVHNQAFNVGRNEDNYRVRELADIVKETVPGTQIEYASDAGPDKRCYRVDCSKIRRVLPSFQPVWDARKGAKELYDSFTSIGLKVDDFEGIRYKRIAHIKSLIADGLLDESLRWKTAAAPVGDVAAEVGVA
jgi:nucleoside-diphosphate-sugar epimerase